MKDPSYVDDSDDIDDGIRGLEEQEKALRFQQNVIVGRIKEIQHAIRVERNKMMQNIQQLTA